MKKKSAPTIDNTAAGLKGQIEEEIRQYVTGVVQISENYDYSQFKLVRRIALFESHTYPTGKFDSQGNYKYWYDIINPRIEAEIKNVDFDTKDISIWSPRKIDTLPTIIANLRMQEYLKETDQDEEINDAVEEGAGWGNVVWKKIKGGYERVDLRNFYVINQTAKKLDDSPVIERHQLSQSDLRAMSGSWSNVDDVIKGCKSDTYKTEIQSQAKDTTVPYYEIYERNGEVSVKDLKEIHGQEPADGDDNKFVFAKVIAAASSSKGTAAGVTIEFIMFAQALDRKDNCDLYKEFHRSRYKGRWFREGLYELLFDLQVRANQIGNQIAQGLELASKILYNSPDKLIVQNILTDLRNGDILRSQKIEQVQVTMQGFTELVGDWNQIISLANDIANSSAIVRGTGIPSGAPYRTVTLLNQNANKLFDFIREKFGIPYSKMFEECLVKDLIKDMRAEDVLRLTGDSDMLDRLCQVIVEDWYLDNLVALPPHDENMAQMIKAKEFAKLKSRPQLLVKGVQELLADFAPNAQVVITGENSNKNEEIQTIVTFIGMEADPIRRSALVELGMKRAGIDVGDLPKSQPGQLNGPAPTQAPPAAPSDLRTQMSSISTPTAGAAR